MFQAGLLALLRVYKAAFSPFLPSACRYYPTCSDYMQQSIVRFGSTRGTWLGLKRLSRCHPFSAGGVDPVPHD